MALEKKYYSGSQVFDIIKELPDKEFLSMLNTFAKERGVDVVERKTGKWLFDDGTIARDKFQSENVHCSICGHSAPGKPWWECDLKLTNFCPNCGAKMKGEDNADKNQI